MTFDGREWTLTRASADFTSLEFSQRYIGRFSEDGRTIEGRWEIAHDHTTWEVDVHLNYTRRS